MDGAADLAAAVTVMLHLYVCRHDDGIIGIGVDVRTAEIADFAKNAKMTADFADFAKISGGKLRQVEQMAEIEPLVIFRHRLVLRAHTEIAIGR